MCSTTDPAYKWMEPLDNSVYYHVNGLVQDHSISSALAMEILQSCTKPSMWQCQMKDIEKTVNSLRPSDAYMRQ